MIKPKELEVFDSKVNMQWHYEKRLLVLATLCAIMLGLLIGGALPLLIDRLQPKAQPGCITAKSDMVIKAVSEPRARRHK